jgi:hypothetical protein
MQESFSYVPIANPIIRLTVPSLVRWMFLILQRRTVVVLLLVLPWLSRRALMEPAVLVGHVWSEPINAPLAIRREASVGAHWLRVLDVLVEIADSATDFLS